jgi:hypothetical protein
VPPVDGAVVVGVGRVVGVPVGTVVVGPGGTVVVVGGRVGRQVHEVAVRATETDTAAQASLGQAR